MKRLAGSAGKSTAWVLALAVAASMTAAAATAPGRNAQRAKAEDKFEETIDVVEVEVPVEVYDRSGEPVRGLTAADFRILDGGKEVPITRFETIDLAIEGPAQPGALPAPKPVVSQPRHLMLLFDLTFSDPIAVGRARQAARRVVLEALHPSDLVAVATFTVEQGPRLLVTFTPDRAQVARAVDSLSFDYASEARALDPLRFLVPVSESSAPEVLVAGDNQASIARQEIASIGGEVAQTLSEMAEKEGRRYDTARVLNWTRGLGELARFLSSVDGRKQVLLFSEGFDSKLLVGESDLGDPQVAADAQSASFGQIWRVDTDTRFGNTPLMNESSRMVEELKRADCVVHSIDVGGLRATGEGQRYGRSAGEETLFFFANESGGQLFTDANDLGGQMREFLTKTSVSYLLGFRAESVVPDGAWRRLKVELVGKKNLKLVYRSGWYAPRPFPELHPFERDLLAADTIAVGAPKNEIEVALLAAPFRAGKGAAYVPVILEIDGESLLGDVKEPRRIDIYAYATTRQGEFRDFFHRDFRLDPRQAGETFQKGGLKYYGHFELDAGEYLLRVLVRDGESGRVGATMVPVRVPDFQQTTATLLPPFFYDKPGRWTMVRERTETSADGSVVYPFVVSGDPFVPSVGLSFKDSENPKFALVGYNLGSSELAVEASWITAEGERPAQLSGSRRDAAVDGVFHWVAELDLGGLPAGEHRFRVAVVERSSGRRLAAAESSLRVEG